MGNALAPITYTTDAGNELTITKDDVKSYFVKGNGRVSDAEMAMFLHRCAAQKLDPFSSDVSLVKWGDNPASIIVGKDAHLKRADQHPQYDGMEYGVTVVDKGGSIVRREGTLVLEGETIAGGWARVHRKDRSHPSYNEVSFHEYDTGKSSWKKMPATMIAKVAKSQTLREAFPSVLAGLYEREEMEQAAPMQAAPVEPEAVVMGEPAATALDDARKALGDAMRNAKANGLEPSAIKAHARDAYGRGIEEMNAYEIEMLLQDIAAMVSMPEAEAEYYEEEVEF